MLSFLKVSNLAILEEIAIEPGPGLNVLTGETGAGKSIVVDAIGLLLGERASLDLIRTGRERLVVEGQFDLAARPDAAGILSMIPCEDEEAQSELIIRREITAAPDGSARGRGFVNGRLVTRAALTALGARVADLHGQHEHQSLLQADAQRDCLDRFAGALELRELLRAVWSRRRELEQERDDLESRERERLRRMETLRSEIAEIEDAGPRAGEDEALLREESLLRHAEEVARLGATALAVLSEDDGAAVPRLAAAAGAVGRLAAIDPAAQSILSLIEEARVAAAEAAGSVARYAAREDPDPARLEAVATRLACLEKLRRKYGAGLTEVLEHADRAREELAALEGAAGRLERIAGELAKTREEYGALAARLSQRRRKAAVRLEKGVQKELEALAMGGTRVTIAVVTPGEDEAGPYGADRIEFLIAPNRGEELRPLARIASGGELSRLMLAVRVAIEGAGDHRTLIFDEVDSGIGGQVAETVGQRLAALSRGQQIFCVTHLPQIASFADRHFRVTKRAAGARTVAVVERLDAAGRVEELARMLGGEPAATARRHAAALIDRSGRRPEPSP